MKKRIAAALPLILAVILCACTTPGQNPGPSPSASPSGSPTASASPGAEAAATPDSRLASSKTYQYFSARTNGDYVVQLRTHSDTGTLLMTTAVVGGRSVYSDIETETGRFTNFEKDGKNYTVMHATKTYMVTDISDVSSDSAQTADNGAFYAGNLSSSAMEEGSVEIGGKSYDYERFTVEGADIRYCFENGDLKYMLSRKDGQETQLEIISVTSGVPDSLFTIPEGYEKIG